MTQSKNTGQAVVIGAAIGAALLFLVTRRRSESGPGTYEPNPDNVTLPPSQVRYIAHEIYVAIWGTSGWQWYEQEERATALLLQCNTNDDVLAVAKVYGCRMPALSIGCLTLAETIAEFYSASQRDELNTALLAKGISISF